VKKSKARLEPYLPFGFGRVTAQEGSLDMSEPRERAEGPLGASRARASGRRGGFVQGLSDLIQKSGAALIVILALVLAVVVGVAAITAIAVFEAALSKSPLSRHPPSLRSGRSPGSIPAFGWAPTRSECEPSAKTARGAASA